MSHDVTRPIIDAHLHLWRGEGDAHASPYLLPDVRADRAQAPDVAATVFVECFSHYLDCGPEELRSSGETAFAAEVGATCETATDSTRGSCAAVVGHAELLLGDRIEPVIEAHLAAAPTRLRGLRRSVAWDEDQSLVYPSLKTVAGMLADVRLREGVRRLARRGLHFETWLYHPQIKELAALADAVPEAAIVLNHAGTPLGAGRYSGRRDDVVAAWRRDMAELAKRPQVYVKLGGLISPGTVLNADNPAGWPTAGCLALSLREFQLPVIDSFTPARAMFESNFPVDRPFCGYGNLWKAYAQIAGEFAPSEAADLMGGVAARLYRISLP